MKQTIIILASLMLSSAAIAQSISVENDVIDLGQIQYQSPTKAIFELRNNSHKAIVIGSVKPSCGCTKVSFPGNSIGAGDKFAITATYDASQMGHFERCVDVYAEGEDEPVTLWLRGQVVEEVLDFAGDFPFKIGKLKADCNYVEFDDVGHGEILQQRFHVYNPTKQAVQPTIQHLPNYLRAEVSPSILKPRKSAEITLTLDSRLLRDYGITQTSLFLGTSPGEKVNMQKEIGFAVVKIPNFSDISSEELATAPKLVLSNNIVNFDLIDGKKKHTTLTMQNMGQRTLEIQNVQLYTSGIQLSMPQRSLEPGETTSIKITADPKQLKDVRVRPRVIMITNDPLQPKVVIGINPQYK